MSNEVKRSVAEDVWRIYRPKAHCPAWFYAAIDEALERAEQALCSLQDEILRLTPESRPPVDVTLDMAMAKIRALKSEGK